LVRAGDRAPASIGFLSLDSNREKRGAGPVEADAEEKERPHTGREAAAEMAEKSIKLLDKKNCQ
jgi:hypothetical protein